MTPGLYTTLSATPYDPPNDPGPTPNHATNATIAVRKHTILAYKEARHIYDNHSNMDDALKAQVIDTIEDTYLCEMHNKYTEYLGVTRCHLSIICSTDMAKLHLPTSRSVNIA